MNNNIIAGAISVVNEARTSKIVQQGADLVEQIACKRSALAGVNKVIADLQKSLVDLSTSVISPLSVMGAELPPEGSRNENEETIAMVIGKMNKAKQDLVGEKASRIAQSITNEQATAETLKKGIDELVTKLGKLNDEPLTVGQVVGQ